jgi:hypothetical protein
MYTQVVFAIDRLAAMAPKHPEWKDQEPYKTILGSNREAIAKLVYQPMLELMGYLRNGGYKTYIVTGGGQDSCGLSGNASTGFLRSK